jgi:peptidoglycan-associated lipoprotein
LDGQAALQASMTTTNIDPRKDPASPLSKRSIYFDFNSDVIRDDYQTLIESRAGYLVAHKDTKVILQGNADGRGSREYNLALSQHRADAARKALSVVGVKAAQMEAVSFGEEKPRAVGDTDQDYAENRRVDIVYTDEE